MPQFITNSPQSNRFHILSIITVLCFLCFILIWSANVACSSEKDSPLASYACTALVTFPQNFMFRSLSHDNNTYTHTHTQSDHVYYHLPLQARNLSPMKKGSTHGFPAIGHFFTPTQTLQQQGPPLYTSPHNHLAFTSHLGENKTSNSSASSSSTLLFEHSRVPLYGGITAVGEFYAPIFLGNQLFHVQVDTGSATLAIPSSKCAKCRPHDHRYDPSHSRFHTSIPCESRTCNPNRCFIMGCDACSSTGACCASQDPDTCGFFLKYGDGSGAQGTLVQDLMNWTQQITAITTFGAILADSQDFERDQVDGVMGMAYPALACNPTCIEPPFDVLVRTGAVHRDVFSICLEPEGGMLTLGGFDPTLAKSPVQYEPMVHGSVKTYYSFLMQPYLLLDDEKVPMPDFKYGIVDSGTTLVVFSSKAFEAFVTAVLSKYCHIPGLCVEKTWFKAASCVNLDVSWIMQLPTITFTLGKQVTLSLSPLDYMLLHKVGGKRFYCLGFMGLDGLGNNVDVILGNTLQIKYLTIYDRQKSRIGFAERKGQCIGDSGCSQLSSCSNCASIKDSCSYDYRTKTCSTLHIDWLAYIYPYPFCRGAACMCQMEGIVPYVLPLGWGIIIVVVIIGIMTIVSIMRASSSQAGYHSIP